MACFGFVTFFPLRPDFSLPCFIAFISVSTLLPDEGEYFLLEDVFDAVFLVPLFALIGFFFVTTLFLLDTQMAGRKEQVVCAGDLSLPGHHHPATTQRVPACSWGPRDLGHPDGG